MSEEFKESVSVSRFPARCFSCGKDHITDIVLTGPKEVLGVIEGGESLMGRVIRYFCSIKCLNEFEGIT